MLPERKPSALTVSVLVRVFENWGFSARHYLGFKQTERLPIKSGGFSNPKSGSVSKSVTRGAEIAKSDGFELI
jgi:hypothetical protein